MNSERVMGFGVATFSIFVLIVMIVYTEDCVKGDLESEPVPD